MYIFDQCISIQGQMTSTRWKQLVDQIHSWLIPLQIKSICSNWIAAISQDLRAMYNTLQANFKPTMFDLTENFIVEPSRMFNLFPLTSNGHKQSDFLICSDSAMLSPTLTWKILNLLLPNCLLLSILLQIRQPILYSIGISFGQIYFHLPNGFTTASIL